MKIPHWLHHFLNPHCYQCEKAQQEEFDFEREQFEHSKICQGCENLKMELVRAHRLNESLIDKITFKPVIEERPVTLSDEVLKTVKTPWKLKRQLLEEADKQTARIKNDLDKIQPVAVITEDDLDAELDSLDATNKSVS